MEKEKVLEIEFQKVWDMWAWRIIKNKLQMKDNEFFIEANTKLMLKVEYKIDEYIICTEANYKGVGEYTLITNEEKECIENFVNLVNEKYGIPKRWKPKLEESFFIVERVRTEVSFKWVVTDLVYKNDHWIDFYAINSGNCFKTYEEAEKVVLKLEDLEKNFWAKVRAGEIGGDE